MSIVNEYSGKQKSDFVIQSIQLNTLEPAEYSFEIIVTDTRTGHKLTKKSDITVSETLNN